MPLPQKWNKAKRPPPGFDYIEPVLEALENELRDKVKESNQTIRKNESLWPVHQISWQKSRYVYDMFYKYNKISRQVYQYCLDQKLVDAGLIAKWKKPGYERLCSTYVINPANYKFGTTSICRVPWKDRSQDQMDAKDPTTGCMGCASGKEAGPRNIFGNKYGQSLAAVQIARERRLEAKEKTRRAQDEEEERNRRLDQEVDDDDDDDDDEEKNDKVVENDDAETDDEDDFGPAPQAGVWAGSQKLQDESLDYYDEDAETDDEDGPQPEPPVKKAKTDD